MREGWTCLYLFIEYGPIHLYLFRSLIDLRPFQRFTSEDALQDHRASCRVVASTFRCTCVQSRQGTSLAT